MNRIDMIRKAAQKVERERRFIQRMEAKGVKWKKNATEDKRLEKEMEAFDEKNVYLNEKEVYNVLDGCGIIDTYNAMKEQENWQ